MMPMEHDQGEEDQPKSDDINADTGRGDNV